MYLLKNGSTCSGAGPASVDVGARQGRAAFVATATKERLIESSPAANFVRYS